MTYWQGVVLGVVQGLTEFLPISSSGHLVLAESVLGLRSPGVTLEVVLHVATLLAVLIVYRARLRQLVRGALGGVRDAWQYAGLLLVGTVPAGLAGVFLAGAVERLFGSLLVVGIDFLVTGVVLWSTRARPRGAGVLPTARGAAGIGIGQAVAIMPGISRSGMTVAAALWLGVDPVRAAEFSFLLAIPAIAGAALLQLPNLSNEIAVVGAGPLAVSFLAALAAGVAAIRALIALLRRGAFHRFAPYCWTIGLVTVGWAIVS